MVEWVHSTFFLAVPTDDTLHIVFIGGVFSFLVSRDEALDSSSVTVKRARDNKYNSRLKSVRNAVSTMTKQLKMVCSLTFSVGTITILLYGQSGFM
jgi:hypothetical protein